MVYRTLFGFDLHQQIPTILEWIPWLGLALYFQNQVLVRAIEYVIQNREPITYASTTALYSYIGKKTRTQPTEFYPGEFQWNLINATIVETITFGILHLAGFLQDNDPVFYFYGRDLVFFIPLSFLFEILFDFFHYWMHRFEHESRWLYKYSHKKHHTYPHPSPIITFYQTSCDLVLSNSIPLYCSLAILSSLGIRMTYLQFSMIHVYKSYIEISGHIGRKLYPCSSFPQCIWLPRMLGIELYAEIHDLHHVHHRCNYAKRFSLWDKVFGTYYHRINE